jgi:4-coumarate--CoA ligase
MAELQAHDARGSQALALTKVAFIEDADCFARAPSHAAPVPLVRPIDARRDVAVLPYSSGTTGRPKGVQLSHHNLVANVLQLNADPFARLAFDERDTLLGLLPLYHIYGMTVLMLGALAHRATLVLLPKFEPLTFFGAIEKHRVSVACLVPPLCLFLAKDPSVARADLSSLKYIYSGAAPLDAALELAVVERLGGRVRVRQVRVRHDGALAHRALADCP